MTATSGDLPAANEADAIEQAQAADGSLDDSSEALDLPADDAAAAASSGADEGDVIEQAQTVKPSHDEEYPVSDGD